MQTPARVSLTIAVLLLLALTPGAASAQSGPSPAPLSDQTGTVNRGGKTFAVRSMKTDKLADGRTVVSDRLIVGFREGVAGADTDSVHRGAAARGAGSARRVGTVGRNAHLIDIAGARSIDAAMQAYKADPRVAYVEPDFVKQVTAIPNDPLFGQQWDMPQIQMPQAWDVTHGQSTRRVAVVDTGIFDETSTVLAPDGLPGHPDLRGKVVARANFTAESDTDDFQGHGTHVSGTISANTNNGLGVAGVGFNVSLMAGKACDHFGQCSSAAVSNAVHWAVDNGASVINLSLGGPGGCTASDQEMVTYAFTHNVVVVVAAGNDGTNSLQSPASCTNALAVASVDSNDARSSFSTFGTWVQVAAPGGQNAAGHFILSTDFEGNYVEKRGTSMAAPHVAGLAALIWDTTWGGSAQNVINRIEHTADQIIGTSFVNLGSSWMFGRINAARAVTAPQPATLQVSPAAQLFSSPTPTLVTASWTISNATPWDWLGMYNPGDPDTAPLTRMRVNCTSNPGVAVANGSCQFGVGAPGLYEVRLFADDTFNRIGTASFVVRSPAASFTASPTTIVPDGTTTVSWSGLNLAQPNDWIGVFEAGAPNTAYSAFRYLNCTTTPGAAPTAGSCVMPIPSAPGTYELRLFMNGGFTLLNRTSVDKPLVGPSSFTVTPNNWLTSDSVDVGFTSIGTPSSTDWIALYANSTDADSAWIDWKYASSCTRTAGAARATGSCPFGTPATPGSYEVRLFSKNGTTRMGTASLVLSTAAANTFSAAPTSVVGGATVTVSWNSVNLATANDWIGLYANGAAADTAFLDWAFTSSCTRTAGAARATGTCDFTMPATAGTTYQFRLFSHGGFVRMVNGTSNSITVTPPPPTTLAASPTSVPPGGSTTVSWTNIAPASATDWIGLYSSSAAANNAFVDWVYVSCSRTAGAPRAAGSCAFAIPSTALGTDYQFRLFANNGFTRLASTSLGVVPALTSLTVSPSGPAPGTNMSVQWSGLSPASATDWIGLFPTGATDSGFIDWQFVSSCSRTAGTPAAAGTCSFLTPAKSGTYEVRLYARNSFVRVGSPAPLSVAAGGPALVGQPSRVATGGKITVSWGGVTSPAAQDWIGLFRVGAADSAFVDWIYVSCTRTAGSAFAEGICSFTAPVSAGDYELRFFRNNGSTHVATSNTVQVVTGIASVQEAPATAPTPQTPAPATKPSAATPGG